MPKNAVRAPASSVDSDEFRMYFCKILPCRKRYSHDWSDCMFGHVGEKVQRRCPRKHNYMGFMCPDARQNGQCPRGDSCCFAHNSFEYWLHPSRYRTEVCTFGASCKRTVCFFAHTAAEVRPPTEVMGPPGHYLKAMYEISNAVVPSSMAPTASEQDAMGSGCISGSPKPAENAWQRSLDMTLPPAGPSKYPPQPSLQNPQPSKYPMPRMQLPPPGVMPPTTPAERPSRDSQRYSLDSPPCSRQPPSYQDPSPSYQLPQAYSVLPASCYESIHPICSDLMVPQYSSTQVSQYSTMAPQRREAAMLSMLVSGGAGHHMPPDSGAGHYMPPVSGAGHHMPPDSGAGHYMPPTSGAGHHMPTDCGTGHYIPPTSGAGHHMPPDCGTGHYMSPTSGAGHQMPPDCGAGHYMSPTRRAGNHMPPVAGHYMPPASGAGHHMPSTSMPVSSWAGHHMPSAAMQNMQAHQPQAAYSMMDTTMDYGLLQGGTPGMADAVPQAVPSQWMQWH